LGKSYHKQRRRGKRRPGGGPAFPKTRRPYGPSGDLDIRNQEGEKERKETESTSLVIPSPEWWLASIGEKPKMRKGHESSKPRKTRARKQALQAKTSGGLKGNC